MYLPQWPQITNLKGALGFHNRRMKVKVANAEVLGAKLTKVIAVIPRITTDETDWLSIHGETETDVSNGIEFVQKTPQLMQKLGGVFASLQGHGPMKFALDLTIPFSKKAIPTRYEAKMALNKAELAVVPWHLVLKDVIGNVYLTEKSVVTDKVTANVFDSPVTLNVTTNDPGKLQSKIVSKMNGHIALDKLQPILGNDFLNFVKGETDYQAILTIPYQSPAAFVFEILSDLKGITLQLPTPFSKKASTENLFRFALTAPKLNQTTLITLSMLNQWNALLLFSNEKNIKTLDKAIIQIGKEMPELPERSAIVLSGYLPTLPLDEWEKFSKQLPRNKSDNVLPFILDMRTDNFDLGGMSIPNPRIQIQTTSVSKIVSIDSQIVTGSVEIPNEKTNKPLDVRLRRLSIMPRSDTKAGTVSIDKIPAMRVLIDQFQYNNKNFGKVSFALNKQSKNMISIDNLEVAAPNLAVIAKGKWMTSGTELAGTLRISQLARALKAWGYPPAINSKQTEVKFNLNWSGSPAAFALAKLNGIFDLTMTNGSIEQLDQSTEAKLGIGKLLSIMSLQTLPRLFSFDFSAVTNKGFTFDRITSRFQLKMGNANTNNLEIEGPVARVLMKGRIGLAAEDYDVQVQINPHVTQGIPVVAAFAGGPIAGATALVVNQLIGDKVVGSIVSYSYTLKGSWQKPIIQENVNGKK